MTSKTIEYGGYRFVQSELIDFQWHCIELRLTIAKQGSSPNPWVAWFIIPGHGVAFVKDTATGEVDSFATLEDVLERCIAG